MGIRLFSSSVHDGPVAAPPNPDPKAFFIRRVAEHGDWRVVLVRYHGCTNFEGNKILVMSAAAFDQALKAGCLDPHFSESGPAPIARFEPSGQGWEWAIQFAKTLE